MVGETPQKTDIVTEAKNQIVEEVQRAVTAVAQQALADKLRHEIKEATTSAKEVVEAEKKGQVYQYQESREKVIRTIVRAATAASKGIQVCPRPEGQAVLAKLSEQTITPETAAAIQANLGQYLLGEKQIIIADPGQPDNDFDKAFKALSLTNSIAAELIRDAVVSAIPLTGEQKQKLETTLIAEQPPRQQETRTEEEQKKEAQEYTETEAKKLDGYHKAIINGLVNYQKTHHDFAEFAERSDIFRRLNEGKYDEVLKQDLQNKAGLSISNINELFDIINKRKSSDNYYALRERSNILHHFKPEQRSVFSLDYLRKTGLIDEDGLKIEGKRLLKKTAFAAINSLFAKADGMPDQDWNSAYNELIEGGMYVEILQFITNFMNDSTFISVLGGKDSKACQDFQDFIKHGILEEIGRERELRELFHNLPIWMKLLPVDKVSEQMARYNISMTTSVVMSDVSGKLVALAMSEYDRYLKFDIMKHQGKLRPSLFAGKYSTELMRLDNEDRVTLRNRIRDAIKNLSIYAGGLSDAKRKEITEERKFKTYDLDNLNETQLEDWEIDRAINYARGLHLTQTMRTYEIAASAQVADTFAGSTDAMYDMAGAMNPNWLWNVSRGELGHRASYLPEVWMSEAIKRRPENSLLKRIFSKGWNPKEINEEVKSWSDLKASEKWKGIKDSWLYKDMEFRKMLSRFSMGGFYSRSGWRIEQFKKTIESIVREKDPDFSFEGNWEKTYQALSQIAGVGTRFWVDEARAKKYGDNALWEYLNLAEKIEGGAMSESDLDKLRDEYWFGKQGDKDIFLIDNQRYTYKDLREIRTHVLRGMNFKDLMLRSPMDFLNNLVAVTPELLPTEMGIDGGTDDLYFDFINEEIPKEREILKERIRMAKDEKGKLKYTGKAIPTTLEKIIIFQRKMIKMWGKENIDHLKFVRNFYKNLEIWGKNRKDGKGNPLAHNKEETFEAFYGEMDAAIEKVKLRNAEKMDPSDIQDEALRELIFGTRAEKGLVTYFTDLNEKFGTDRGKLDELGDKGFFYHIGRAWFTDFGHSLNPDSSDIDWRYVFENIGGGTGETVVKRLWSDLAQFATIFKEFSGLDDMLRNAAITHKMDKIMELHGKIHTLKGPFGKEPAQEMNYYFAQIVARYFQETSASRMPFYLGTIYGMFNGKTLSLSKIHGGKGAMSLTTDGINAYFQQLANYEFIPREGVWGFDRLSKALGADWEKLITTEIIPNIAAALALFLFYRAMKDALEEMSGKKKH
jgi:hypothetical protein